jgi:hypothetical protein
MAAIFSSPSVTFNLITKVLAALPLGWAGQIRSGKKGAGFPTSGFFAGALAG